HPGLRDRHLRGALRRHLRAVPRRTLQPFILEPADALAHPAAVHCHRLDRGGELRLRFLRIPTMVKLDKIYTRGGDKGMTSLGNGERVPKHDLRVEAYGAVDEANAAIGLARLHTGDT